jgi:hypothetical protein
VLARFHARGSQIYTCKGTAGIDGGATTYAWTLKAPDAKLYDDECALAATHFAGPTWQSSIDGSAVVGARVAGAPSPLSDAIPWLLLKAVSNTGEGIFASVTAIQRVDTTGGVAPATGCSQSTVDTDTSVPYTATYYFYVGGSWDGG